MEKQFSMQSILASLSVESMDTAEHNDKYRNSPIGEALELMDGLKVMDIALESIAEGARAAVSYHQDAIVAEAYAFESDETIGSMREGYVNAYKKLVAGPKHAEYSLEAANIIEQAKRVGYKAKSNIKELINKIITWVMGVVDYVTAVDGSFKSYAKMIKKYREKMNTGSINTKEDKEVSIKNLEYGKLAEAAASVYPSATELNNQRSAVKSVKESKGLVDALIEVTKAVVINKTTNGVDGIYALPTIGDTLDKAITDKDITSAAIISAVETETTDKNRATNVAEWIKTLKDVEYEDMRGDAALTFLNNQSSAVQTALNKDFKFKKAFADLAKDMKKASENLTKKDETDSGTEISQAVLAMGSLIMYHRNKVIMPITKAVQSELQVLIKDMAKVINFNTTIKS